MKKFLLTFHKRVTSDERRETAYIFSANAQVEPIIEGQKKIKNENEK